MQKKLTQKPKADVAKLFIGLLSKDKYGRPKSGIVPGSDGKQYRVILRRNGRTISTECHCSLGGGNHKVCPGNNFSGTVCYHSMSFVDYAIDLSGFKASWCNSYQDAKKLHKMVGGTIFNVKSYQNQKAWKFIVVTKVKK